VAARRLRASIVVVVVVAGEVRSFHAKQAEDDASSVDNRQTRLYLELPAPRVVACVVCIYIHKGSVVLTCCTCTYSSERLTAVECSQQREWTTEKDSRNILNGQYGISSQLLGQVALRILRLDLATFS
jgi:hypothetical protein